jgi:hypothetical protein
MLKIDLLRECICMAEEEISQIQRDMDAINKRKERIRQNRILAYK